MRIVRLRLGNFGHFRDREIDLDHRAGGLRIVLGPNEAGKSTIRSAIVTALFGRNERTTAGQPTRTIEVDALISGPDTERTMMQRRGSGGARHEDGRPFTDEELAALIVVSEEMFETLFCLGHDDLRRSAHRLLQTDGGLGRVVFGAALGGGRVEEISKSIEKEIESLHASKARKKKVDVALEDLASLDRQLHDLTITATAYASDVQALADLQARIEVNREKQQSLDAEVRRLERIRTSAPIRRQLLEAGQQIEQLEAIGPVLVDGELEEVAGALEDLDDRKGETVKLTEEIEDLHRKLAEVPNDLRLLDRGVDVRTVIESTVSYREATTRIDEHRLRKDAEILLPDSDGLEGALSDAEPLLKVAGELLGLETDIASQRASADSIRLQLGLAERTYEQIVTLPVPSSDDIEQARRERLDQSTDRGRLIDKIHGLDTEIEAARKEIRELERTKSVSDIEDIKQSRMQRDEQWLGIRRWFVDGVEPPDPTSTREAVAVGFEQSLSDSDQIADSIVGDVAHAARISSIRLRLDDLLQEKSDVEEVLQTLEGAIEQSERSWASAWGTISERPQSPAEMEQWRQAWEDLVKLLASLEQDAAAFEAKGAQVESARERLLAALEANGHGQDRSTGLPRLHNVGDALIQDHRDRVDKADQLRSDEARRDELDRRIESLLPLIGRPELRGEDAIQELSSELSKKIAQRSERDRLEGDIEDRTQRLNDAEVEVDRIVSHLAEIAAAIPVAVEDLAEVARRSSEIHALRSVHAGAEVELIEAGGGLSLEVLLDEAHRAGDLDEVSSRLSQIAADLDALRQENDDLVGSERVAREALERIRGSADAAALADDREEVLARISEIVDEYIDLTLQRSVLNRAIDEAQAGGESGLVEDASRWFALFTNGEFERIDLETIDGVVYAIAVRADGSRLYPSALSDGTLDQLWLAWRFAGIEHHVRRVGPVPVIVDDVLVHFDDDRCAAAFRAMSHLSRQTQVVILTHHPHLVEIARRSVGDAEVEVTELGSRPANAVPAVQIIGIDQAMVAPPERAPTPPRASAAQNPGSKDIDGGEGAVNANGDDHRDRLLAAIDSTPRSKVELLQRSGIDPAAWSSTIKALVASGEIEQQGTKRGAKYARADGCAAL